MPRTAKEKTDAKKLENTKALKSHNVTDKSKSSSAKTTKKKTSSVTKTTSVKKVATTKKTTSKTTNTKTNKIKNSKTKSTTSKKPKTTIEYYDLPFRYNQTMVKILAQTPNTLFIYWDISDKDRATYIEQYGIDFFNNSKPILVITNETMNYTFEVEINDFANSWYLHVNDANCKYKIELGRKYIENTYTEKYIPITSSNEIEAPNDHILFEKLGNNVFFRNIKTNLVEKKNITTLSHIQNMGKVYNIYDLYKKIYKNELNSNNLELNLPTSNSSTFK